MSVVKALFLAVALYGLIRFWMLRMAQPVETSISLTLVSIGSVMTLAGILNLLPEAATAICIVGILYALYSLKFKPFFPWRQLITPGTVFLAIWALWGIYYCNGLVFSNYDDFTHWGLVFNHIFENDRLPNYLDTAIYFQSYPTGTACLLYFLMRFLPRSEGMLMLLQFLITASCVLPIFPLIQKHRLLGGIAVCALSLYLLTGPGLQVNCLLVDRLLPMVAVAGLTVYYQNCGEPKRAMLLLLPYLLYLPMVKTSGMLFALPLLALLLYNFIRRKDFSVRALWTNGMMTLSPFLMYLLWKKHTSLVFTNPDNSKHAFSLSSYAQTIQEKTLQDMLTIARLLTQKVLTDPLLYIILIILVLCVLLTHASQRRSLSFAAGAVFAFYIIYHIGMILMYLFSMPTEEALLLGGFERYHLSISLFTVSMLLMMLLEAINTWEGRIPRLQLAAVGAVFASLVLLLGVMDGFTPERYLRPQQPRTKRIVLDELIAQNGLASHRPYLLVDNATQHDGYATYFLLGYLWNNRPEIETPHAVDKLENYQKYLGGIIVLDASDEQWAYIQEHIRTDPYFADKIYGSPTLYSGWR